MGDEGSEQYLCELGVLMRVLNTAGGNKLPVKGQIKCGVHIAWHRLCYSRYRMKI